MRPPSFQVQSVSEEIIKSLDSPTGVRPRRGTASQDEYVVAERMCREDIRTAKEHHLKVSKGQRNYNN